MPFSYIVQLLASDFYSVCTFDLEVNSNEKYNQYREEMCKLG